MPVLLQSPLATLLLLAILGMSVAGLLRPALRERWALRPAEFVKGRWSQILTSGFVHETWGHLLMNGATFVLVGFSLEHDLALKTVMRMGEGMWPLIWGHAQFLLLWVVGMVVADVPSILRWRKEPEYSTLGSSGAVSALVTAMMVMKPSWMLGAVPGWAFALFYMAFSLWGMRRKGSVINHSAHLFGAVAGAVMVLIFFPDTLGVIAHQVRQWWK